MSSGRNLILAFCAAALAVCAPGTLPRADDEAQPPVCAEFAQFECMQEAKCVYDGVECQATDDICELVWDELNGTEESCERHDGCTFSEAEACYCPPNVDCACGGGAPPTCRSEM